VGSVVPLGDANDCGLAAKFDIEQGLLDAGMTAAKALERGFRLLPHPCSAYAYRRCFSTSNSIQKSLPDR